MVEGVLCPELSLDPDPAAVFELNLELLFEYFDDAEEQEREEEDRLGMRRLRA